MGKLKWDDVGQKQYEAGVSKGVLFVRDSIGAYPKGVVWNGLINVVDSPSGAEPNKFYADNINYGNIMSAEESGGTIEAYTYPDEFAVCDGSAELSPGVYIGQQDRTTFGLSYRTEIGNDINNLNSGYKIHLVYGALASPSEKSYETINDSPEAMTFSWEYTTTPVPVYGKKPTATLVIDSRKVDSAKLALLEEILYGNEIADARLPLPDEIATIFAGSGPNRITLEEITPANEATNVAINATVTLQFNNKIVAESILLFSEIGEIVNVTKEWDETGKILTLTPTAVLDYATTYMVTVTGVIDKYNQPLNPLIKTFTTVNET